MNKDGLIDALARQTGMTKVSSELACDAVFRIISDSLIFGEKVQIAGFGTFEARERAPRVGRNPRANTPVNIPARKVPFFKPTKGLKDAVSESKN